MDTPLSDTDLSRYGFDKNKILKYSQLKEYRTIDEILPKDSDYVILLLENEPNSGHWCCICKHRGAYTYFNSFGLPFDSDLSLVPRMILKILGEDRKEIKRLLNGKQMHCNQFVYQGVKSNTCGRWVVCWLNSCLNHNMSLDAFKIFIKSMKSKYKCKTYDDVVLKLVS